jgi:hypothetical protein
LAECDFERWIILGDYLAIYDESRKLIEANIMHLRGNLRIGKSLMDLPGVSWGPPRDPGLFDEWPTYFDFDAALADPASKEALLSDRPWSLPLREADEKPIAEFSSCSPELLALDLPPHISDHWRTLGIKIFNQEHQSHDEAFKFMEQMSSALFFEMDLRYGMQFGLVQRRLVGDHFRPHSTNWPESIWKAPKLPRVRYQHDAVSLYLHGRSSARLPLSQFLAHYQAIEYHFPMFVRRDLLMRLRNKLRDPGFSPESNEHLHQLIRLMGHMGSGRHPDEWEQLATTLSECVDEVELMDFLKEDELRWKAICDKNTVKGVHVVNEKNQNFTLVRQIAKRIYQIRCRIVHAKEDGGPGALPMLLPTSPEARDLWHDIDVVRYLTQRVIIAGAEG